LNVRAVVPGEKPTCTMYWVGEFADGDHVNMVDRPLVDWVRFVGAVGATARSVKPPPTIIVAAERRTACRSREFGSTPSLYHCGLAVPPHSERSEESQPARSEGSYGERERAALPERQRRPYER
jgi:hypothetical protein